MDNLFTSTSVYGDHKNGLRKFKLIPNSKKAKIRLNIENKWKIIKNYQFKFLDLQEFIQNK